MQIGTTFNAMSQVVRNFYDDRAENEWRRLIHDPYHRLEFIVTMHFLDKYLPRKGLILDAGGGPGRYTIELAKKGYDIVLFDLSAKCLKLASKKIRRAHVEHKVKEIVEGSITDLSAFADNKFDSVLCLGPLSHLTESSDRENAATELVRVTRKSSPIFVSVIGLLGVFRTVLQRLQHELTDPTHQELFEFGIHRRHEIRYRGEHGFPDAYFWRISELKGLFERNGVKTLEMATCEGLSSHLQGPTDRLYKNKDAWAKWVEILLKTCTDPTAVSIGEHLLYVGRK